MFDNTKLNNSWFEIYSKSPSLPNTTNFESSARSSLLISGSQIMPISLALWSPMDLVIARPGLSSYQNQTRKGPPYVFLNLFLSFILSILPPESIILFASVYTEQLCSVFSYSYPPSLISTPLESPVEATNSCLPTIKPRQRVLPEFQL